MQAYGSCGLSGLWDAGNLSRAKDGAATRFSEDLAVSADVLSDLTC